MIKTRQMQCAGDAFVQIAGAPGCAPISNDVSLASGAQPCAPTSSARGAFAPRLGHAPRVE